MEVRFAGSVLLLRNQEELEVVLEEVLEESKAGIFLSTVGIGKEEVFGLQAEGFRLLGLGRGRARGRGH